MAGNEPQSGGDATEDETLPVNDEYSQRPQKPIRLKPGISQEKPSEVTRRGPPAEILATATPKKPVRRPRASGTQWTLRGISPEVREAITQAAKEDGVTTGTWVDQALREAWAEEPAEMREDLTDLTPVLEALEDIRQRLEALEQRRGLFACLASWLGGK